MKYRTLVFLGIGVAALIPAASYSAPSAFTSKCGALTINNATPSTLMRDTEDCKLVWVLPPNAGTTQLAGFTPSGNLGMCQELKDAQIAADTVLKRMAQMNAEVDDLKPQYDAANEHVVKATAKVHNLLARAEIKQLDDLAQEQAELDIKLAALDDKIEKCQHDCEPLNEQYKDLRKQRSDSLAAQAKLRRDYLASVAEYDRAKAELDAANEERNDVGAGIDAITAKQSKFHKELIDLVGDFSRWEGGYAHLDYDTLWDKAVSDLTHAYGSDYQFRKVDTQAVRVFGNLVGAANEASYLSSLPAILDYNIDGIKYLPFGESKPSEIVMASLPSHFSGAMRLSLVGACPLYYKNFLARSGHDALQPSGNAPESWNFAVSTTYQFPAAYHLSMHASYNLWKFYEKIVESSSSGGLFSSHQATSIAETKLSHDTFEIDWTVEDPSSKYDENTREKIGKEIKMDLIGRVLSEMAQPAFQNVATPTVPNQQGHGAVVLADGLQQTCGFNIWCTAGSWVLRGLDAIFGSNSASNSFRSTEDRWATDNWSATTTRWNTGATLFTSLKQ